MKRFLFILLIILALFGQGCQKPLSGSVVIQTDPNQPGLDVIKALRHELEHAVQRCRNKPADEQKARAAEGG